VILGAVEGTRESRRPLVGFERSESAVAVLGLEGFVLLAAVEVDGELHQLVETEAGIVGCPGCGTRALSKGRRTTKVRDLSCGGRPVVVVWNKRLWRCGDADCDVKSWSETNLLIAVRASMTERARSRPAGGWDRTTTPWPRWVGPSAWAGGR
jgi:DNA-directed RNA polymerase subunit RPC12/RpoP